MKPIRINFIFLLCSFLLSAASNGQIKNNERATPLLKNIIAKKKSNEIIYVFVSVKDLSKLHNDKDIQIVAEYKNTNTALVKIQMAKFSSLLNKQDVLHKIIIQLIISLFSSPSFILLSSLQ